MASTFTVKANTNKWLSYFPGYPTVPARTKTSSITSHECYDIARITK
jgi:hypothetical protein